MPDRGRPYGTGVYGSGLYGAWFFAPTYNFGSFVDDRSIARSEWDPSGVRPKLTKD